MIKKGLAFFGALTFCFSSFALESGDFENAVVKVAATAGSSVVSVSSTVKDRLNFAGNFNGFGDDNFRPFFEEFFGIFPDKELKQQGLGSGVIIDKEGYILTNEHVVGNASEIKVKLADGREFPAELKGVDMRTDLAVIKIDAQNLPVAVLGDSDNLKIGAWIVAIGNPFGFAIENPEPTVTVGVVSALHRTLPMLGRRTRNYDDLVQTDAAINPGNSGGPLVNLKGEVVGINTAIITTTGGYQGLGFAIPVNKAKKVLQKLVKGEKVFYGWLGVSIQDLNDDLRSYFNIAKDAQGVLAVKVYQDSPAEKSGIKDGDLITVFDGKAVKATKALVDIVSTTEVGKKINLTVIRDGKPKAMTIVIGKRPGDEDEMDAAVSDKAGEFRGLEVDDISPAYKQQFEITETKGVVVIKIEEGSCGEKSGISEGDVITEVNKIPVKSSIDFDSATKKAQGNCLIKTNRGYFIVKAK